MPKNAARPRVLLISDFAYPLRAGTERLVFGIAQWLSEKYGMDMDILTPNWGGLEEKERVGKVTVYRFKTHSSERSRPIKRIKDYVAAGVSLGRYDIYHGFYTLPPVAAAIAISKIRGAKSVISLFTRHQLERNFTNPMMKRIILKYLLLADAITTTFWSFEDHLRANYFPNSNLRTVPCWVEDHFLPGKVRKRKGRIVLFVGRMVREKGIFVLLEAFAKIQKRTGAKLVMIGPPVERARIREAIKRLGIGGKVEVIGYVPEKELPGWYNASEIVVAPSFDRDSFAWTLMEAMACGKPIITTEKLTTPIKTGELGGLAEPEDVPTLENAMLKLLTNAEFRKRCSRNARRTARKLFDKREVMAQYLRVYEEILG